MEVKPVPGAEKEQKTPESSCRKTYRLIAFDMDGTLLNSKKEVDAVTGNAVHLAAQKGKTAVYCTGRAPSELEDFRLSLPDMRYAICNNGSLLWDMQESAPLFCQLLPSRLIGRILKEAESETHMVQIYTERGILYNDYSEERLTVFGMGEYLPLYRKAVIPITAFETEYHNYRVCKLSVHLTGAEARERLKEKIEGLGLPLEVRRSNRYTLEFTDLGVTKAFGLEYLCGILGIALEETIAVGDGGNDIDVLEKAGLGIAVANATEEVKKIAAAVVADNDHAGCAEAVEKYLLP